MTANSVFIPARGVGWRRGLKNMMGSELSQWYRTNMGWIQALIWVAVLVGLQWIIFLNPSPGGASEDNIMLLGVFAGLFVPVAVIIIMQDAVVGEKQTGTAAWILSKPVSRAAFILSKFFPNLLGMLVTMLAIPGIGVYILWRIYLGNPVGPAAFLAGMLLLALNLIFFQTLTLMLGAFFNHRGPVIGLSLAFLFLQQYLIGMIPILAYVLPYTIVLPTNGGANSIFFSVVTGAEPFSWLPVIATSILSVLFIASGIWRFGREEF